MPVETRRAAPSRLQATKAGAYLTDGKRLFRVLPDAAAGKVWLEDCAEPLHAEQLDVRDVVKRMRLVTPAADG